jgi:hypothetical protein
VAWPIIVLPLMALPVVLSTNPPALVRWPEAGFEILGEDRCGVGRQRGETEQGCGDGGECDFFGVHFSLSRIRKIIPEEIGLQTSSIYSK